MRFDLRSVFFEIFRFCDVMMKTLTLIKEEEEENHNRLSISLSNRTFCPTKQRVFA
jgi:hypothetical protein